MAFSLIQFALASAIIAYLVAREFKVVAERRAGDRANLESFERALDSFDREAAAVAMIQCLMPAMVRPFVSLMGRLSPDRARRFVMMFHTNDEDET